MGRRTLRELEEAIENITSTNASHRFITTEREDFQALGRVGLEILRELRAIRRESQASPESLRYRLYARPDLMDAELPVTVTTDKAAARAALRLHRRYPSYEATLCQGERLVGRISAQGWQSVAKAGS